MYSSSLPPLIAEDADIGRKVVAVHQFHLEKDQLGTGRIELEAIPVLARGRGYDVLPRGAGKRQVLQFVAGGGHHLPRAIGVASCHVWLGPAASGQRLICRWYAAGRRALRRHAQFGAASGAEEAVEIGVAGVQRLGEQHAAAFHHRHRDARVGTQGGG